MVQPTCSTHLTRAFSQSLHVLVDPHLLELEGGGQVLAALQTTDVVVHVTARPQPGTITWERDVTSWREVDGEIISRTTREPEDQIVAVYAAEAMASLIEEQTADPSRGLTAAVRGLGSSSGKTVTALCWGLDKLRRTKPMAGSYKKGEAVRNGGGNRRKGAPNLDRLQMEAVLVDTLLDTPHNFRFVNSPTDGGEFLAQMSKAIAEAPFKRRRAEPQFSWFAEADSARPVKVDREQRGLRRLWAEQLTPK
ncbi:crossover junction endonuclease EME1-like [Pollicipes pollicipes]|uniref:crossover junction endonuclease EME1-like n=1 Tax=Pollicipes pollicipes TaxID=41117 RepID=UPI0018859FDC|nr:crossover junction endonuclease EME1-like [Pollicipes pollicipes]